MNPLMTILDPTQAGIQHVGGTDVDVIPDVRRLDPFLMSVASVSDVWLFMGSHGGVTAGRRDPDHAVLPYYTEDKLADVAHVTGPLTMVRSAAFDGRWWEPAGRDCGEDTTSWLAKTVLGDEVVFGVRNHARGLEMRSSWRSSPTFGIVRECRLANVGNETVSLEIVDGLQNLLPSGATELTQNELSVLLDAYKRSEIDPGSGLGMYSLSSMLTDLAEPSEALQASVVWRVGPEPDVIMASSRQLEDIRNGAVARAEHDARGVRGAFLAQWTVELPPGEDVTWMVVADTDVDTAGALDLRSKLLDEGLADAVRADLDEARRSLATLLAQADGVQVTGDQMAAAHHLSSVMYNAMRGGIPRRGLEVEAADFRRHVARHNAPLAERLADVLAELPEELSIEELRRWGAQTGDPDLARLSLTYLPLSFGRRHGDPSRPWNRFEIVLADDEGNPINGFQGNWRDIFQNWEALAWSYPSFVENMAVMFLNATTVDGYNPYRITHKGVDWEVPESENPWANIGYWGDHQIVYLLRLLEFSANAHPGQLEALANEQVFSTADVPYRLAGFDQTVADPSATVDFDTRQDLVTRSRAAEVGGDGLLRHEAGGGLFRTTMADKLLLLAATKLSNFVPDGGIWMNTQRPEWNDANNALAGSGLSVVTMSYLGRFLDHLAGFLPDADLVVRPELAEFVRGIAKILSSRPVDGDVDDALRLEILTALGRTGERYREAAYAAATVETVTLTRNEVATFLDAGRSWIQRGIRSNRREDGLYHSYNTLRLADGKAGIGRLPLMLEGQVAVLSAGELDPSEALAMLTGLRASDLYRQDQHSYTLYPNRDLPGFLDRNQISTEALAGITDLEGVLGLPGQPILTRDGNGGVHFAAGLRNAAELRQRLSAVTGTDLDEPGILAAFEDTFQHANFTGRSGTFFAYEGLGSIYWHMVSKLALAALETQRAAARSDSDPAVVGDLFDAFRDIRAGLGFAKSAEEFGAFPADAYSHTPAHTGARQPGMTGQVKEDVVMRYAELGVRLENGQLFLEPSGVADPEWLAGPAEFRMPVPGGSDIVVQLGADELAFSLCGVPIVYERGGSVVRVGFADGSEQTLPGGLDVELSQRVLSRDDAVAGIRVVADRG